MRYSPSEKLEIIRLVEQSDLPVQQTLAQLDVGRSSFYRWYQAYVDRGAEGLEPPARQRRRFWNQIPDEERDRVVELALSRPELTPRELAWQITDSEGWYISESSVYRILKARDLVTSPNYIVLSTHDRFPQPTVRVHQLWQTDFTYLRVTGWGWYYLGSVLDDYSRYVITWRLFTGMAASDVQELLDAAIAETGVDRVPVRHRPRLLSDNGPCYVSRSLQEYLREKELGHTRGKPYHPMTQGKIERYHRTLKNVVKLQHYWAPWELEQELGRFIRWYNEERYHESLDNLTPEDVYLGRGREIQTARQRLKAQTLRRRKWYNQGKDRQREASIIPSLARQSVR